MRGARFPVFSPTVVVLAIVLIAVMLPWLLGRHDPAALPGQTWRRGFLGGDQLRLLDDGRYQLQHWSCVGPDETFESGRWHKVGTVVSLVPAESGKAPYLMRMVARDGDVFLADSGAGTRRGADPDDWFERED